jgi:hypothetical protein
MIAAFYGVSVCSSPLETGYVLRRFVGLRSLCSLTLRFIVRHRWRQEDSARSHHYQLKQQLNPKLQPSRRVGGRDLPEGGRTQEIVGQV